MENMDKKVCEGCEGRCSCGGGCGCGMHMHGCHGRHGLLRIILKLIVVAIIFCFGFQLGQMTGYIRAGYGGEYSPMHSGYGWGMMRGYDYGNYPGGVVPQGGAPAATK